MEEKSKGFQVAKLTTGVAGMIGSAIIVNKAVSSAIALLAPGPFKIVGAVCCYIGGTTLNAIAAEATFKKIDDTFEQVDKTMKELRPIIKTFVEKEIVKEEN